MKLHPREYQRITMDTLRSFASGFASFSQPSKFALYPEKNEVIFGMFEAFVSDELIATAPHFVHYVPNGRVLDRSSLELHHCTIIVARIPTKFAGFFKVTDGLKLSPPLLEIRRPRHRRFLFRKRWNCMFLLENNTRQNVQVTRVVGNNGTRIGYLDSVVYRHMMEN